MRRALPATVLCVLLSSAVCRPAETDTSPSAGAPATQETAVATRPSNVAGLMDKALAAAKAGQYAEADQAFKDALAGARNADPGKIAECYYEYARFNHDWAMSGAGLTKTQRGERFQAAVAGLRRALGRDPDFLKARQFLTDIYWTVASNSQNRGWNEFIKEADELIKLKGDDHLAYFRRGLAKANLVSPEMPGELAKQAIEDLQKAVSLKKDKADYWLGLVGFFRKLEGHEADVEQTYQKAMEAMPGDAKLLIAYAGYLQEQKKPEDARKRLDDAIRIDPVLGNLALADYYSAQDKLDEALKALESVLRLDKSDARTYLRKAAIFARQGQMLAAGSGKPTPAGTTQPASRPQDDPAARKTAEAIAVLKEGLAAVEKDVATQPAGPRQASQAESRLDLNFLLADLLLDAVEHGDPNRAKMLDEAADCMRSMIALGLSGPRKAKVAGRIALAQGKIPEAVEELESAFATSGGQDIKAANLLINIYLRQGLPGKAEAVLDRLLSIPSQLRNVSVLMAKARLRMRFRDFDKADQIVTRVLQLDPANAEAVSTQAMIRAARSAGPSSQGGIAQTMGKSTEDIQALQQAATADPNNPDVVDRLFRAAMEKKDWKLADDCIVRARKANLDGVGGRIFEARLAVAKQDYAAAGASALEALKAQPNRKDARVILGQSYMKRKQYDQAYEEFKTVATNDPGYAPALVGLVAVTQALGKPDEHRAWVEAAYRLTPQDPYIRQRHFDIERETTSPEEQIKEREKLLKQEPDDLNNLAYLGGLYERTGRAKDAEDMFLTLHDRSEDKLYSARMLCSFYLRKGRIQDVERTIEPMLDLKADPVGVRVLYGELVLQQDAAKAKGLFEKAITANVNDPRGHLGLARYWAASKDWSRAVESMTAYVRLRPQDQGGAKELVRYAIEAGETRLAEKRLEEMLQADPSDTGAVTLKGSLALRMGQTARAMDLFSKAIQDNPNFAEPLVLRARLFLVQGDPNRAKADLQVAKRLSNRLDVSMQLVDVYLGLKDFGNAELVLRELHTTYPSYGPAIEQLIDLYLQRQKWRELEELLGEARKASPTNPGYWLAEARMWNVRQDEAKRLDAHAQAVKVAPMAIRPVRDYLIALQESKKYETVLQASQSYVDKEGFVGWVDAFRATALAKLNRQDEADKAFLKALQIAQPTYVLVLVRQLQHAYGPAGAPAKFDGWLAGDQAKNWRLYLVLGVLYGEANDNVKALEALSKARDLATDPLARFLAWRHLGATWYSTGKFADAEKAYLACLMIRDDDVQVLNNLAYLYTNDLNQPRKGLPLAEKAAQLSPDNVRVLDTYGWTLAKVDRMADAEGALIRAVQLEGPLAVSRYHLGWIYEQTGRLDEALKQYRQGLEMIRTNKDDPLYGLLKEALDRVGKQLGPSSQPADGPGILRTSGRRPDRAKTAAAASDIANLGVALGAFEVDCGRYPTSEEGLRALIDRPADAKGWAGPYLKKGAAKDPWGNPYVYRCPGRHNPQGYDLHSSGPDGRDATEDDINSWPKK
jgi:general secretion pathway protein G